MATQQQYIDDALSKGIPLETIQNFLAVNPGDAHRLSSALAENLAPDSGQARAVVRDFYGYDASGVQTRGWPTFTPTPMQANPTGIVNNTTDVHLIASAPADTLVSASGQTNMSVQGWRDVLGSIVGMLPLPGAGLAAGIIGSLPEPRPVPQLPGARTPPIVEVPELPPRTGGGMTRGQRAGAIAAAAAAVGLTVAEYLHLHPELRARRHINPLNVKALKRSLRRTEMFTGIVKRVQHDMQKMRAFAHPPKHYAAAPAPRSHRAGCGCVVCRRR